MISFVVPYFEDTKERAKNIDIIKQYYKKIFPAAEIIIESSSDNFNKCRLYNNGLKRSKNDIVCFLDSDVIISKPAIEKGIELSYNKDNVVIGYSGVAIYLTYTGKSKIEKHTSYEDILEEFPYLKAKDYVLKTADYELGNNKAVGGCLIMHKNCAYDINGYNPNFVGWGYEDNEIVLRSHKLKKNVIYVNNPFSYLFHLPHHDIEVDKSKHAHYTCNYEEYTKIASFNPDQIKQYIKTWKI
jgi:predicted glycosyltransferase involved in capsule biosynthesis